ncbi:MAG: hypothetical protein K9M11_00980 [Candidatus Pacebacteria bacterium]|nr:hypothetical protein [Candidatus Paceibacterota bacterium]
MTLDFNTLDTSDNPGASDKASCIPKATKYIFLIIAVCFVLSLTSVVLGLLTLKNIPKPEPVSIQCDPDLIKKIEKQAQVFEEITKSTKTQK